MLEEALPVAAGVAVALLPCMAFGGLVAARGFMILGGGAMGGWASGWPGCFRAVGGSRHKMLAFVLRGPAVVASRIACLLRSGCGRTQLQQETAC